METQLFHCKKCSRISNNVELERNSFLCPSCGWVIDDDNFVYDVRTEPMSDVGTLQVSSEDEAFDVALDKVKQVISEADRFKIITVSDAFGNLTVSIELNVPRTRFRVGQVVLCPDGSLDLVKTVVPTDGSNRYILQGDSVGRMEHELSEYNW